MSIASPSRRHLLSPPHPDERSPLRLTPETLAALERLVASLAVPPAETAPPQPSAAPAAGGKPARARTDPEVLASLAQRLYRLRRTRDERIGGDLFADPAWDILLDLYVQRRRGVRISVTSLCLAAHVPASTALRWMNQLDDRGLLAIEPDPTDQRRRLVSLSPRGEAAIVDVLLRYYRGLRTLFAPADARLEPA